MTMASPETADVGVYSFTAAVRNPTAHFEFDLNSWRDPMGSRELTAAYKNGSNEATRKFVSEDPRFPILLQECINIMTDVLHNGGKWTSIGFRDYHGKWKSRAVADLVGAKLSELGHRVVVVHAGQPA